MASSTSIFSTLQHKQNFFSIALCKYPSSHHFISHLSRISFLKHTFHQDFPSTAQPKRLWRCLDVRVDRKAKSSSVVEEKMGNTYRQDTCDVVSRSKREMGSGFSSLKSKDERVEIKSKKSEVRPVVDEKMSKISKSKREIGSGFSSPRTKDERVEMKSNKSEVRPVVDEKMHEISRRSKGSNQVGKDRVKAGSQEGMGEMGKKSKMEYPEAQLRGGLDMCSKREMGSGFSSLRSRHERVDMKSKKSEVRPVVDEKISGISKRSRGRNQVGNGRSKGDSKAGTQEMEKKSKKTKVEYPEAQLRGGLDMCSKRGDFLGAISLYDSAQRDGIKLGQYHYTVLLYLCSSAAVGIVRPAKSGSGSRSVNETDFENDFSVKSADLSKISEMDEENFNGEVDSDVLGNEFLDKEVLQGVSSVKEVGQMVTSGFIPMGNGEDDSMEGREGSGDRGDNKIHVSEDVKRYALMRGFEIYEKMCLEKIPLNEATLTAVARMAMSMDNGNMAFEMVTKMKGLGIKPRLRSYGPALFTFCNGGDIEKAFMVEEHMLENGVYPEEPELEALLRLSIGAGRGDKVYYLLHNLRTSVRKVSSPTAHLIETWFRSKEASRVGRRKWDQQLIMESMENGGGGWHGQGWLGKGKWVVSRTLVGNDGVCGGCGEKLVTIDLDPTETENFAKSVASIAAKRERHSSFQNFQKWLDYYGPFEAVVDAANVGLFSQRRFLPTKVNAIVNGIRQKLPSKKWPLIVVHHKRVTGDRMEQPVNKMLIEKWKTADALYATPTGSNDDWYWLYAAIKFKCLLVTNDEMRDHVFQLLGNDFFPKWKERHQVRFSFGNGGPEFHMPPPCSVVIQESEKGHWHIPIVSEHVSERQRLWLCVTRATAERKDSPARPKEANPHNEERGVNKNDSNRRKRKLRGVDGNMHQSTQQSKEIFRNLRSILSWPVSSNHRTLISDIVAAEKLGGCIIDFQI